MNLRTLFLLSPFLFLMACTPLHAPVPAGSIPEARPLSVEDEQYGHQVLQALSERYQPDYNNPRTQNVQDIVDRLTHAAHADKDPWHVYILKDSTVKNAAATRGNHVFVWTGMLESTHSDEELATVLSHEISHILAGHTDPDPNEEVKQLLINIGAIAAGVAVSAATRSPTWSGDLGRLASSATQELGNGFLLYPYSRDRELEADQIGLFIMADAKYNPSAAIDFWTKIPSDPDYREGPSFLSTHPAAEERIKSLRALLPQAMSRFQGTSTQPPPWRLNSKGSSTDPGKPTNAGLSGKSGPNPLPAPLPSSSPPAASGSSSAPGNGPGLSRDSFALNGSSNSTSTEVWTVTSPRAVVYRSPSLKSQKLGEFAKGAEINVIRRVDDWLELHEPGGSSRRVVVKASELSPKN